MAKRRYWLVKSEEDAYSIDDLESDGTTPWDGIRNYEARNLMRDEMKQGDKVLYYHSNAKPPGVVGIARVASDPYPDPLQFDPDSRYHDPRSTEAEPRWILVDLGFEEKFSRKVPLQEIKDHPALQEMVLVNRMRLSVQPVTPEEFKVISELGRG